jgi:hypothetical protein
MGSWGFFLYEYHPCQMLGMMLIYPRRISARRPNNTLGEVAQLVEQRTHKPWVAGSSPALATTKSAPALLGRFSFLGLSLVRSEGQDAGLFNGNFFDEGAHVVVKAILADHHAQRLTVLPFNIYQERFFPGLEFVNALVQARLAKADFVGVVLLFSHN